MAFLSHGENGIFSVPGYGSRKAVVVEIQHGLQIIAGEDEAASRRGFYPRTYSLGTFSLSLQFAEYRLFTDFSNWFAGYVAFSLSTNGPKNSMRVQVPSRHFDRLGVPNGGINLGRKVDDVVYSQTINFIGGQDAHGSTPKYSRVTRQTNAYYPGGAGLNGHSDGGSALFGQILSVVDLVTDQILDSRVQ